MRRIWLSGISVAAMFGIVVGVNMIADARLGAVRADLTQQKLYTLSPGTLQVLRGLKEPVTLRLFYSRRLGSTLPLYGTYADRVREMLREYASASNGKVRLEFYDPEPFSDIEDRALGYGLQGVPLDQSGEQIYFGLVGTNLLDDERTIPFLQPQRERFLEFDLTHLVYDFSNPQRAVVGVMSSLPLDGDPRAMMMRNPGAGRPWAVMQTIRQVSTVKHVPLDAPVIDPDVQVLLVAQAQNLSDATLYAIDQFVMRGGRLMAMVDPQSEAEAAQPGPDGMPPQNLSSDLHKLFDAYGIGFDPAQVVGDLNGAWRVRSGSGDRVQASEYVAWYNIRDGIAHDDPATAELQQITVAAPGALTLKPGATLEMHPLLTSSDQSALIPAAQMREPDPAKLLAAFKPQGGPRVIAARFRGKLHSAFSGPPALKQGEKRPDNFPAYKSETDGPANVVVAADSDILADRFWVRTQDFFGDQQATPFSDNGPFVANVIGTLAGGDVLAGLRSRGDSIRPFALVERMQNAAEAKFRQTENTLQQHLDDVQKSLVKLRQGNGEKPETAKASQSVITEDQRAAIDQATQDILNTRRQLRAVQLNLDRDISNLRGKLQLANIALVPALLAAGAVVLAVVRRRRRARARA